MSRSKALPEDVRRLISRGSRTLSEELLSELHLISRDGSVQADSMRKLKQVMHLMQILDPLLNALQESGGSLYDLGAGKSYLGLAIYDFYLKDSGCELVALEERADLSQKIASISAKLGYARVKSETGSIRDFAGMAHGGGVLALHACDTATDEAIDFGLKLKAQFMALVPCCQAELARKLKGLSVESPFAELVREPLHRREFGALATNVLRKLRLESQGYRVTVTEFTSTDHTPKNELLIAEKISESAYGPALERLERFREFLGISLTGR